MRDFLSRTWWVLVLRGVAALLFGVLALVWPGITLLVLIVLFAAYALVGGALELAGAFQQRRARGWWLMLLLGIASVAAGLIAIAYPGITAVALVLVIGISAIFWGVLDIAMAIRLRRELQGEWLLGLAGFLSIVFGVILIAFPGAGALALVWLIGIQAVLVGVLLIGLGLRLRALTRHPTPSASAA